MSVKQISLKSFHKLGKSGKKRSANKARAIRRLERERATAFEVRNSKRSREGWTV